MPNRSESEEILEPQDAADASVTGEEEVANEEGLVVLPKHRLKRMKRMKMPILGLLCSDSQTPIFF